MNTATFTAETHATTAEWVAARSIDHRISASIAGAILGLSPHGRPWDVWAARKRTDLVEPHDADTLAAFARGHVDEEYALRLLELATGETFTRWDQRTIAVARGVSWLTCTPDAIDGNGEPIEMKSWRQPMSWPDDASISLSDDFPRLDWLAQLAIQCAILGTESGRLLVLDWRSEIHTYRVRVDAETIAALVSRLDAWRTAYLVGDAEPPADAMSDAWRNAITRAPKPGGDLVDADDDVAALCRAYADARRIRAAAEKAEDAARDAWIAAASEVPGFRTADGSISWTQRKGGERLAGLDEIRKAAPDVYDTLSARGLVRSTPATRYPTIRGFNAAEE